MTGGNHGHADLTEATFTADHTLAVLHEVCRITGLNADDATLLRHQTNGVYRLNRSPDPIVVKIARPGTRNTADIVALVQWLREQDVPIIQLYDQVEQPLTVAGCAITLWRYLPSTQPITTSDIAAPLYALHHAGRPPIPLPSLDPVPTIRHSIDTSTILSETERHLLHQRCADLAHAAAEIQFHLPVSLIHGDPQHRNTLWDNNSQAVLADVDSAGIGPPEWDLITIDVHCRRFGYPIKDYRAFCQRYGTDIREWQGYSTFSALRELKMITSNARKSRPGTRSAQEVHRRIANLNTDSCRWNIL